jgi:predicted metal-binding protein
MTQNINRQADSSGNAVAMRFEPFLRESGFSIIGRFDVSGLLVKEEVRDMCAADRCRSYGRNWSCPPACGSIDYYQDQFGRFSQGYLFQTVVTMGDAFDYEAIQQGGAEHNRRLDRFLERIEGSGDNIMVLGAGACSLCEPCTYPDAPCPHPNKALVSMEAAGLLVSEVCGLANVP